MLAELLQNSDITYFGRHAKFGHCRSNGVCKYGVSQNLGQLDQFLRSLEVTGSDEVRLKICDFLIAIHNNHGPIFYRFRDMLKYWSRIANFSYPPVFNAPLRVLPSVSQCQFGSEN